jgi:4a-hydroxytetrahydrobiopterin dehydratase
MNWKEEEGKLVKEFQFNNFTEAVDFINNILPIAEENNHHPDILLHSYKMVKIMIYTHDENKITDKDYKLAEDIESLIE